MYYLKKKKYLLLIIISICFLTSCSDDSSSTEPEVIDLSGNWKILILSEDEVGSKMYYLFSQSGSEVTIKRYYSTAEDQISFTLENNDFTVSFTNKNGITTTSNGSINDSGTYISGTWSDTSGESGTWNAEKVDVIPVPWCVDLNKYKIYGSNVYETGPNFPDVSDGIWDMEESDWEYIGEGNETTEFEINLPYSWIMITWSGKSTYYFDAIVDEVANEPFGLSGYSWITRGLSDYSNFKDFPDNNYAHTYEIGLSAMTFPNGSTSIAIDPNTGKGEIKLYMTTNP